MMRRSIYNLHGGCKRKITRYAHKSNTHRIRPIIRIVLAHTKARTSPHPRKTRTLHHRIFVVIISPFILAVVVVEAMRKSTAVSIG